MGQDVFQLIERRFSGLSKGHRNIGKYILTHYDKAAFMTAAKLGMIAGVSESTVVRFAHEVGYDGYPQLQHALQEMVRRHLTAVQRMEVTTDQIGDSDVLSKVLMLDIEKIRRTLEETSCSDFDNAVRDIARAENIYIMGIRSAATLSGFISYYFNHMFENARLIDASSASGVFEQMFRIKKNDVFIAISFPRYSNITVSAANFARGKGASVIAITDSADSPLASSCDNLLLARSDMISFIDSLVAPLSLINALIVAVGMKKKEQISDAYLQLEKIWEEYCVYEKADNISHKNDFGD